MDAGPTKQPVWHSPLFVGVATTLAAGIIALTIAIINKPNDYCRIKYKDLNDFLAVHIEFIEFSNQSISNNTDYLRRLNQYSEASAARFFSHLDDIIDRAERGNVEDLRKLRSDLHRIDREKPPAPSREVSDDQKKYTQMKLAMQRMLAECP